MNMDLLFRGESNTNMDRVETIIARALVWIMRGCTVGGRAHIMVPGMWKSGNSGRMLVRQDFKFGPLASEIRNLKVLATKT
jgi:hypothetical protein